MLGVLVIGNILNMAKLVVQGYQGQPTFLYAICICLACHF